MDGLTLNWIVDLLIHLAAGMVVLYAFSPSHKPFKTVRFIGCSFLFVAITLPVQQFLTPWVFQGSLLLLWVLMVILANKLAKLPLLNAMGAIFCYFCLSLAYGLIPGGEADPSPNSDESLLTVGFTSEEPEETNDGNSGSGFLSGLNGRVQPYLLHTGLSEANITLRGILYKEERVVAQTDPTPTPPPPPIPVPASTPPPSSSPMSQEEFLAFFDGEPDPQITQNPQETFPSLNPTPTPYVEIRGENVIEVNNAVTVNSNQLNQMVKIRNRSTDPEYMPPKFSVGAIGLGANGRYAIINNQFVKEGTIIRVTEGELRGWKLVEIEPQELFWQPLL